MHAKVSDDLVRDFMVTVTIYNRHATFKFISDEQKIKKNKT